MSESSEILRRAAKVLREHAEAATDGPWEAIEGASASPRGRRLDVETVNKDEGFDEIAFEVATPNASYVAMVHPPVGLALADWLEIVAAWPDEGLGNIPGLDRTNWPDAWQDVSDHALTLARAILREAPDA